MTLEEKTAEKLKNFASATALALSILAVPYVCEGGCASISTKPLKVRADSGAVRIAQYAPAVQDAYLVR